MSVREVRLSFSVMWWSCFESAGFIASEVSFIHYRFISTLEHQGEELQLFFYALLFMFK